MREMETPAGSVPTIAVRCAQPGVVLSIDGPLDERACELLAEVVDAALAVVQRPSQIHVDLSRAFPCSSAFPRALRQVERAGATVTRGRSDPALSGTGAS